MTRLRLLAAGTSCAVLVAACAPLAGETSSAPLLAPDGTTGPDAVEARPVESTEDLQAGASAAAESQGDAAEWDEQAHDLADEQADQLAADVEAAIEAEAERVAAAEEAARQAEEEARREAEEEKERVEGFQATLEELGYYTGKIDGDAGPRTEAAVEDFQAVNGLEVDGVVGKNTQAALDADDAKPKPPPEPEPEPEDEDEDEPDVDVPDDRVLSVSDAKVALRDLGYFGGEITGKKTDQFESALMAFQKVQGIGVDGSLGPNTSAALRDPRSPSLKGGNSDRIEIDLTHQVIHVVKGGTRIRTMPTSSGNGEQYLKADGDTANAKTPVGDFVIQRRITGVREADLGTLYDPLYFYKGWAIHGSNNVPAYPASHGCTRVTRSDILWLADQMPNGTQVRVYGGEHTFIATG